MIGTRNRAASLLRCLESIAQQRSKAHEVIVLDDASDVIDVSQELQAAGISGVRVLRTETPLGVGPGRNQLFAAASGDVFFVLDDDAFFDDPEGLAHVESVLRDRPRTGIIATRIIDHQSADPRVLAPFPRRHRLKSPRVTEQSQRVSYFLGGGYAIRRDVYEQVGGFHDAFVFGEEELDLSYRAIQGGFEIFYAADVVVRHIPMPSVLQSAIRRQSEIFYHTRNRLFLSRQYLPVRYIVPYLAIWLTRYAVSAARNGTFRDFVDGVRSGASTATRQTRTPLTREALSYLRQNHGRLWF